MTPLTVPPAPPRVVGRGAEPVLLRTAPTGADLLLEDEARLVGAADASTPYRR
jgi:hypothetical protein